jgi:hypothetical protein
MIRNLMINIWFPFFSIQHKYPEGEIPLSHTNLINDMDTLQSQFTIHQLQQYDK